MSYVFGKPLLVTIGQWWFVGWRPNFFSHHSIYPHHWMVTKNFQFSKRVWACAIILEKLKNSTFTFFLGRLKNFDHHQMVWMCRISTKKFQLPSNGVGVSDGDQNYLVTVWWWGYMCHPLLVTKKFQSPFNPPLLSNGNQKGWGPMLSFWGKKIHAPLSLLSDQQISFAIWRCVGVSNGDWNSLVATKKADQIF